MIMAWSNLGYALQSHNRLKLDLILSAHQGWLVLQP